MARWLGTATLLFAMSMGIGLRIGFDRDPLLATFFVIVLPAGLVASTLVFFVRNHRKAGEGEETNVPRKRKKKKK
jgi:hypothetical protein